MKAALSIRGLYNYDNSLFDNMAIPVEVDKETLVGNLLVELAELEIIYPSSVTMSRAIQDWSNSRVSSWERILDALNAEYNPIENYDRKEDWIDNADSSGGYQNKVAGFNIADQTDSTSSKQQTKSNSSHSGRIHGNIGVTMAQQMITAEIDMRAKFDIMQIIVNEFKQRFCIMVY